MMGFCVLFPLPNVFGSNDGSHGGPNYTICSINSPNLIMFHSGGVDSSSETYMMHVGDYEIKPPLYKEFIKKSIGIHTSRKLERGLVYFYLALYSNVIDASIIYKNINH
jgi:hypothetical protein